MSGKNNTGRDEKQTRRFDQKQYNILKRCSDKKDTTEWNEWRKKNPNEPILLEGGNFHGFYLCGAFLNTGAVVINPGTFLHEQWVFRGQVYLRGSAFLQAKLCGTDFRGAHIEEVVFNFADLEGGCLELAYLQKACFLGANLQGANLTGAKLQGTDFSRAIVDGGTLIWQCEADRKTKFEGVGLDTVRIYSELKQLLEYNIRRMNWEDWYKGHKILQWPVRWFWCVSDYGLSTWRIIWWFLGLALFFAAIYANFAFWYPPGIISHLTVWPHLPVWHYFLLLLFRPIYFSVITMTTGFGDMYANSQSICGHILLIFQATLGYVLLGALITRLAVLFTGEGPAGKFSNEKKEDTNNSRKRIS